MGINTQQVELGVLCSCAFQGHPTRKFSKMLEISFSASFRLFQSFLKAYLCKLIWIDLFGFFS